jgi:hypothetical protein
MKTTRLLLTAPLLVVVLQITSGKAVQASNAIAKQEAVACTTCHDKPGSKLLTSKGKYYELKRTLEGHDQLIAAFGPCTNCHVRRPGSAKLTREGRQLRDLGKDMAGLERWLVAGHTAESLVDEAEAASDSSPSGEAGTADGSGEK